jgi:membrane protease YdiL (CAAX protease family)
LISQFSPQKLGCYFQRLLKPSCGLFQRLCLGIGCEGKGLSVLPKIKTWAICLSAIGLFCVLILFFEVIVDQKRISFESKSVTGLFSMVAFFIVSPFMEELFFRGLVLNELTSFMRPVYSNIAASFLFVGIHLPYWISSGAQLREIASTSVGVLLFSFLAGWLCFFSKSIWPPTVAHAANNILSSLIGGG